MRRGKPTVHVRFDEATALLVGDALQSLAFQLLSDRALSDDPARQLGMVKLLAVAAPRPEQTRLLLMDALSGQWRSVRVKGVWYD